MVRQHTVTPLRPLCFSGYGFSGYGFSGYGLDRIFFVAHSSPPPVIPLCSDWTPHSSPSAALAAGTLTHQYTVALAEVGENMVDDLRKRGMVDMDEQVRDRRAILKLKGR